MPSQVRGSNLVDVEEGQLPGSQTVPASYLWQPPVPSHCPFVPQSAAPPSGQEPDNASASLGTLVQVPDEPARLHDRHPPVQTALQQTPCEQIPV